MSQKESHSPTSSFHISLRPRFGEFDAGGVLYHANYFHLYEEAREALLNTGGMPYLEMVKEGRHLAVIESYQRFFGPVVYGEELQVKLWITELRGASAKVNYEFTVEDELDLRHSAWTKHVFVEPGPKGLEPRPFPKELRRLLETRT